MLGKVLKYDIKFGKTPFLVMAGAMVAIGVFTRIVHEAPFIRNLGVSVIFALAMVGIAVGSIVLIFQHFNKSMFSAEGYLTLTLPVKRRTLLISKLITTVLWFNVMLLALSIMLLFFFPDTLSSLNKIKWYDFLSMGSTVFMINLMLVNVTLLLYLIATAAHISVAGRRLGWWFGGGILTAMISLEVLFATKFLAPVAGPWALWLVLNGAEREALSIHITKDISPFLQEPSYSSFSVDLIFVATVALFSVLIWFIILHCLKKRVDLP